MALPKRAFDDAEFGHEWATSSDADEALERAEAGERVLVLGGDGNPVAAAVPLADLRRLEADDRRRAEAVAGLYDIAQRFRDLDPDETDRQALGAVDAIRAEWRGDERNARP